VHALRLERHTIGLRPSDHRQRSGERVVSVPEGTLCVICDQPAAAEIAEGKPWCAACIALPEDERRRAGLRRMMANENAAAPFWHYLSFADERGFLGVCWVEARGFLDACRIAHAHGCNPGGSVKGMPLPQHGKPPDGSAYVLHTDKAEIDRLCGLWTERIN
jgi:hypothetical protein